MKKLLTLLLMLVIALTFVACQQPPVKYSYQITFESNGGSGIQPVKFNTYVDVKAPAHPTLQNATFVGWFTDEGLSAPFDFSSQFTAQNYTLYAKWKVNIFFETNGGEVLADLQKEANEMVILPIAQDTSGRSFAGWYLDAQFTQKADGLFTVPNHPVKLYANWANIETGSKVDLADKLTVNESTHYTLEKVTNGYKIAPTESKTAWSYCYTPIQSVLTGYNVLQLSFKGTKDSYMTVKLEGGNAPAIEQKFIFTGEVQNEFWTIPEENIAKELGQRVLIFVEGDKSGNDFESQVEIYQLAFCKLKTGTEVVEESIIFDTLGGSSIPPIIAPFGSALSLDKTPTKAGFVFDGWYVDSNCATAFTSTTMPKGPTTLYAKWVSAPAHKVSFVTNTDAQIADVEVVEGLPIAVDDPICLGWQFVDWYTDQALTVKADMVMGKTDVTLYAKWKTLKDLSDTQNPIDVTKGWVSADAHAYTLAEGANGLTVAANTAKGKFSYIGRDLAGNDLTYVNALHLQFSGKIGQSFLVKYNNKYEKKITITTQNQEEWIYLEYPLDVSYKLMIFYAPNQTLIEQETITFSKIELLEPLEKLDNFNILQGWFSNDAGHYTVVENTTDTVITATTAKTRWSFAKIDLGTIDGFEGKYAIKINMELVGPQGHQIIVKYNNAKEYKITLTGAKESHTIVFEIPLDLSVNNHLIMFFDGNVVQEEEMAVTFTKMEIVSKYHEVGGDISYEYEEVDILKGWTIPDAGSYVITENATNTTVDATPDKKTWSVIKYVMDSLEYNDFYSAKIILSGPAGHTVIFKYNNAKEQKITLTGQKQEVEVVFAVPLDKSKALYFFIDGGKTLEENVTVVFEKISLVRQIEVLGGSGSEPEQKEYTEVDLLKGWIEADAGTYNIVENATSTVITATTDKKTWSVAKLIITDMPLQKTYSFKITLCGPAGHTVIFKYNNAKEQKITLTGEEQQVEVVLALPLDTSKSLYFFFDGGKTLDEEMTVTFTKIVAVVEV